MYKKLPNHKEEIFLKNTMPLSIIIFLLRQTVMNHTMWIPFSQQGYFSGEKELSTFKFQNFKRADYPCMKLK